MKRELESLGQQRLEHQAKLIVLSRTGHFRSDVESVGAEPAGAGDLKTAQAVRPLNARFQGDMSHRQGARRAIYVFAIVCEIARLDDFNRGSLESSVHRRLRVSRTGIEQSESDGEYQALDERIACSGRVAFLG